MRGLRVLFQIVVLALFMPVAAQEAAGQGFETRAGQAFMVDAQTGAVLFSRNADDPVPPASLAKLMTMEVVFDAVKAGRLSLSDEFYVSENAWRTGGAVSGTATMFAEVNSTVPLEALIRGVIVQTANDACIAIAEGISGSEEGFARLMNERAKAIGLENSVFVNSTGLPAEGQHVTMRDLVRLALHLQREYPEFYGIYAQEAFTWNGIFQRNRNPLLRMEIGAEGLAMGFAEESGYAAVAVVNREGRRLVAAMSGLESEQERIEEARKILDWGMRAFSKTEIFAVGEIIGHIAVFGGEESEIGVRAAGPVTIYRPQTGTDGLSARIVYTGPVEAPIEEGQRIGTLQIWIGDMLSQETPVFAAEAVGVGTLQGRAVDAFEELLIGWLRKYRS